MRIFKVTVTVEVEDYPAAVTVLAHFTNKAAAEKYAAIVRAREEHPVTVDELPVFGTVTALRAHCRTQSGKSSVSAGDLYLPEF